MPNRQPSLRALAAFEAAARRQSFARAAEELNLTPGAVSHAIRSLEERLGDQLFQRVGRGVELTPAGQAFAARVRVGLSLIGDAFGARPEERASRLVVSILPSIASKVLIPAMAQLCERLSVQTLDMRLTDALESFEDAKIDVAVRFGPGAWPGVSSRRLAGEVLYPVCSPAYLQLHPLVRAEDILSCDLIGHPSSSWKLWFDLFGLPIGRYAPAVIVDDAGCAVDAAREGLGVTLARGALARHDLATGRLVRPFTQEVAAEYSYWCVWRPPSAHAPRIALFSDWLSDLLSPTTGADPV